MVDYPNEILGLINSLNKPRYATQDAPHLAPILFDGTLQNERVTFIAASNDPHDYGVDTWNRAQAGEYGPISPYVPVDETPPIITPETAEGAATFYSEVVKRLIPNPAAMDVINQAITILDANDGKVPSGPRHDVFLRLAEAWSVSLEDFVSFVTAIDTLRFTYLAAFMIYNSKRDQGDSEAGTEFRIAVGNAIAAYNSASTMKIEVAQ